MCPPDVSPGPSLPAGRTSLQMRVTVYVCTFIFSPKPIVVLSPAVPSLFCARSSPRGERAGCPLARCAGSEAPAAGGLAAARGLFPELGSSPRPRGRRLPHLRPQKPPGVSLPSSVSYCVVKRARDVEAPAVLAFSARIWAASGGSESGAGR